MTSSARSSFSLSFELSPIILVGGIAANIPGGQLPIVNLTQGANVDSILSGSLDGVDADDYFAHFVPVSGSTLIDQQLGDYPLANQQVAANAVIEQPLVISMLMIAPAKDPGDYLTKQAVMSALVSSLAQHNITGGLYNVATPAYLYQNCILRSLRDVTGDGGKQKQSTYQFDFVQPLLTLAAAQAAQNSLISKTTNGAPVTPDANGNISPSGLATAVGDPSNPSSTSVVGLMQNLQGTALTGLNSTFSTGVVGNIQTSLSGAVVNAESSALTSFNLSKVTSALATTTVNSVGSSIAGIVQTAATAAVSQAQAAALYAGIPGRGQLAAQFSVSAAINTVNAATQALQRGLSAQIGSSGLGMLQTLQTSAQTALAGAQAALSSALPL